MSGTWGQRSPLPKKEAKGSNGSHVLEQNPGGPWEQNQRLGRDSTGWGSTGWGVDAGTAAP